MAVLNSTGLAAEALVLEITETVLLDAAPHVITDVRKLRAEGIAIAIAIDDFGTGYASLRYPATLPITCVKVDRSFTAGFPGDPTSSTILSASVNLAADSRRLWSRRPRRPSPEARGCAQRDCEHDSLVCSRG